MADITLFLANSLNQILASIPLSILGNFSTDAVKMIFTSFYEHGNIEDLEDTFFQSFIKALEIHQSKYDMVARSETEKLKSIAIRKRKEFLLALNSFDFGADYQIIDRLNENQIRQLVSQKIIEVFKEDIPEEKLDLVTAITRDTCRFYRDAFFQKISQEQQLWIVFRESLNIKYIADLIKEIQPQIPTREEFESIRSHIIKHEVTPENVQELKQKYLDYLERKFSSIELTGVSPRVRGQDISFELEEIFIPFNIEGNEETNSIFRVLSSDRSKYSDFFRKDELLIDDKIKLLKILEKFSKIILLGDPGGGKTTLLKYITCQMCKFQRKNQFLPSYLPIFLRISEYAQTLKLNPSKRLLDFLTQDYDKQFRSLFQWAFNNCQVLLLLDGLDEVLDTSQRLKVVEEVQDIVARMPENRYIITSRIVGYDSARIGKKFKHLTIKSFNREQINGFCQSWYKAVAKNSLQDIKTALSGAERLYNAIINKRAIENLACNPLMITLIANIHFKGQNLPYSRVQLYDIATETLLQYWVQHRVTDERQLKDKDDVVEILSPIAFYIHQNNPEGLIAEYDFYEQCKIVLEREEYDLSPKEIKKEIREIIKFLREQSGFFHEKGIDESIEASLFGFLHQTFQEYFTAIEIVNQWKEGVIEFDTLLQNIRWTESFRLAAGILNTEKGRSRKRSTTQFVEDILRSPSPDSSVYTRAILLVALILVDNIDITPQAQNYFFFILFKLWAEDSNKKENEDIEKHLTLLLESKYKDIVLDEIKLAFRQDEHPLHPKLPKFITRQYHFAYQNISFPYEYIDFPYEYRKLFYQFLLSEKPKIYLSAWEALKQYTYNAELTIRYEAEQYGGMMGLPYNPVEIINILLEYSSFLEIVNLVSEEKFSEVLSFSVNIFDSYFWVYFSGDYYQNYSTTSIIAEIEKNESARVQVLLLSLLIEQNDLLSFESELQEILKIKNFQSEFLEVVEHEIAVKISQLKEVET